MKLNFICYYMLFSEFLSHTVCTGPLKSDTRDGMKLSGKSACLVWPKSLVPSPALLT